MPPLEESKSEVWSEDEIEAVIAKVLKYGSRISALVVLVGGIIFLSRHGTAIADYREFHGHLSEYREVIDILKGACELRGRGLIMLGVLLLILTPVARVAFSTYAYAIKHDRAYMILNLVVLVVLLYSLFS